MPRMARARASRLCANQCFNGASASMPRMDAWRWRRRCVDRASTGPRHRCRGWVVDGAYGALLDVASTGPRHRCRGWIMAVRIPYVCLALQRGLGIDAEDGPSTPRAFPAGWRRFNGASASMPRMGRAARGARARADGLQRGLGIDAEDGVSFDEDEDGAYVASTGPRHRCRGWRPGRQGR